MKQDINEIMTEIISPQDLAKKKLSAYQEYCIAILEKVKVAIQSVDVKSIVSLTFDSPAGDEMGWDNKCINFGYGDKENWALDINQAVEKMQLLKDIINGKADPNDFDI